MDLSAVFFKLHRFQAILICTFCLCNLLYARNTLRAVIPSDLSTYRVYYDLENILHNLNTTWYQQKPKARLMLETFYEEHTSRILGGTPGPNKFPFIVVHGSNKLERHRLTRLLARNIKGQWVRNPKTYLSEIRNMFSSPKKDLEMKKALYYIENYIFSFNVRPILEDMIIVLNGYWMEEAADTIVKYNMSISDLPSPDSFIYDYPPNLQLPDILISVNTNEENKKLKPLELRTAQVLTEFYRRVRHPVMFEMNSTQITDADVFECKYVIKKRLAAKFRHLKFLQKT